MSSDTAAPPHDPWGAFLQHGLLGPTRPIGNADVEISAVPCGRHHVPLVTNRKGQAGCSWVASLRNAYGPYARAETDLVGMSRFLQPVYVAGSRAAEALLAAGGLAGGNYLNNWLLATNLYHPDFTADAILATLDGVGRTAPALPVVIRSLTAPFHADLLLSLVSAGFLLLPSRQVWVVHDPASGDWRQHRDSRRDLLLAKSTVKEWEWVRPANFTAADFARIVQLYQRLYRERYPIHNPDYTEQFFRVGVSCGFLDLIGLRPASGGPLCGFVGMIHRAGVSCTPVLGYDIDAPISLGLYRRLMLHAFLTCETRRTQLHCSAGAGLFKFNRGAQPHVEFAAVWANHLPWYRRTGLRALSATVLRCVVPYLETHRL